MDGSQTGGAAILPMCTGLLKYYVPFFSQEKLWIPTVQHFNLFERLSSVGQRTYNTKLM